MSTQSKVENPVSPTIGDTLSKSDRKELYKVADNSAPDFSSTTFAHNADKAFASIKQFAQTYPLQTAGIALLGGAILHSILRSKS